MRIKMVVLLWVLCGSDFSAANEIITIQDGDTDSMVRAMNAGRFDPSPNSGTIATRVVQLAANGHYVFSENTHGIFIDASVRLLANGAVWTGRLVNQRITITARGDLQIEDLNVSDLAIELNGLFFRRLRITQPGSPWITNQGNLIIRNTSFVNVTIENRQFGLSGGLITSSGAFRMENTTISNLRYKATSGLKIESALLLRAGPDTRLSSNTITNSGTGTGFAPALLDAFDCGGFSSPATCAGLEFTLEGNILTGNAIASCREPVTSLGHNIFGDESCGPFSTGDQFNEDLALLPLSNGHGPVTVHPLPSGSPAIDAAGATRCMDLDANGASRLSDGDGDGLAKGDIGAFEFPGVVESCNGLTNGLFIEAGSDGHYVQIFNVSPNRYSIFWSTFDQSGQPAWILAIGDRDGGTISAEAFISVGGRLNAGGQPVGQEIIPWGAITIAIEDCQRGKFEYASSLQEFGSGQFDLNRLAFVQPIGCD